MHQKENVNYLNVEYGIKSWLFTKDHKRIGVMYLIAVTLFFIVGALAALGVRLELLTPEGDLMSSDAYNRFFTMHGVIMIFLFLIPSIPAVLGNFVLPIMIGARDLAFPRINLLSWYIFIFSGIIGIIGILKGGIDTGWTFYTPYSSIYSHTPVVLVAFAAFLVGFSSILTGLNFIATVHTMRAPGLSWFRLPLFVWAMYATSLVIMLGTPVVAITLVLLILDRAVGLGIFNPTLGGDPVLFQHLFWFYSHPAVYIMILPAMGVVSEVVSAFSRKKVFGYKFIVYSSMAIAVIGFLVWGHHMYTSGQSALSGIVFSILTVLVGVPTAVKILNWTVTLYRGSVSFEAPMLYALGFMGLFIIGGLTGLFLAALGTDVHLHDTYFVVAHFHYTMVGGAIMGFLAGLHYWWPKITGRMYPEFLGKFGAIVVFVGFHLTFLPQFVAGYLGMPRRYHYYVPEFQFYNILSTAGATILGAGMILVIGYLVWSARYGEKAVSNPWRAVGLEWETASPPHPHNFEEVPRVEWDAYDYEYKYKKEGVSFA